MNEETRGLTPQQIGVLMAPLHPSRIKNRNQGGAQLSYVEAYDVKATLVRVFGFGGFSAEVVESRIEAILTGETHPFHKHKDGNPKTPQVLASATVRLTIPSLSCVYTETAIGANSGWDIGEAADNAIKTAESDALKRCATYLGSQFGLSLYDKGSQAEVIKVLLEPGQAALLAQYREEQAEQVAAQQEQTQALVDRATGAAQERPSSPEGAQTPEQA